MWVYPEPDLRLEYSEEEGYIYAQQVDETNINDWD